MSGEYVPNSIWFYAPNKGAPVAWAIFFTTSAAMHFWQCNHYKSWRWTFLFPWAAIVFTAGYIMRELGAYHYDNLQFFISSVCLVYAAPPFYEFANYIILGRILYYVPYHSPMHPGRVTTTFGAISAVVESINGNGASYSSKASLSDHQQDIGRSLIQAALILQLFVITSFITLAACFHRRCSNANLLPENLRTVLYTLYASSTLLLIRTIYRVVEYNSTSPIHVLLQPGFNPQTLSPVIRYEAFFWVFEGLLMLANSVLLNVRHPGRYLPRSNKVFLAQDGVTEIEGPGYKDHRSFLLTLLDPGDLFGLFTGRDKKERYWEQGANANTPEVKA